MVFKEHNFAELLKARVQLINRPLVSNSDDFANFYMLLYLQMVALVLVSMQLLKEFLSLFWVIFAKNIFIVLGLVASSDKLVRSAWLC